MMSKENSIRRIVNRNVDRLLVKEFLMKNTKKAGFGGLDIVRTPAGTKVTVTAERVGMVIGRRGKIINELQRRLNETQLPTATVSPVPGTTLGVVARTVSLGMRRGKIWDTPGYRAFGAGTEHL